VSARELITEHLDLWTGAVTKKSSRGRGSNGKVELTGIKKLRELVLKLAVMGKLVHQDPSDESVSTILNRIEIERTKLVVDGKLKKRKTLPQVAEEEMPFELPSGWEWVRLGTIAEAQSGYAFKSGEYTSEGTFVLRVTNINQDGSIDASDAKYITPESAENNYKNFQLFADDVLLVMVGGSLGKIGVVPAKTLPAVLNQNMWKIQRFDSISRDYFVYGLKQINAHQIVITSSTHGHLSKGNYLSKLFPLPPIAEQNRIVQKVDELMTLCNRLEQQTSDQIEAHKTLVDTLLGTLTQSENATELTNNWARLAAHFDTLFTTEQSIDKLMQTILQLAVMGRLVEQDTEDEPATSIVSRASRIKAQLLADKLIKKQKELPGITEAEKPASIPSHWTYARLDDVCTEITSGSTPPKSEFNEAFGVPYLKVYNIRSQRINFKYKPQFITGEYHQTSLKRSKLLPGDVVMNIVGPPLGKTAVIPADYPEWNCNQAIVRFRPIEIELNHFIHLYLKAGIFLDTMELIGTAGQDNISVTKSRSIVIPLPPKAEQHRIVQKVDELMTLCDQLKERLNQASGTRCQLAEAAADKALN